MSFPLFSIKFFANKISFDDIEIPSINEYLFKLLENIHDKKIFAKKVNYPKSYPKPSK